MHVTGSGSRLTRQSGSYDVATPRDLDARDLRRGASQLPVDVHVLDDSISSRLNVSLSAYGQLIVVDGGRKC
jgi:hypothetical protein